MATRTFQGALQHEGDFRLDLRMDQFLDLDFTAVRHREIIDQETEARRFNAHLLHLGMRSQTGFQTDDAIATRQLAAQDFVLDRVGVIPVHLGMGVGDFHHVVRLQLGVFQMLGQLLRWCF
jgi:hypothetical protein